MWSDIDYYVLLYHLDKRLKRRKDVILDWANARSVRSFDQNLIHDLKAKRYELFYLKHSIYIQTINARVAIENLLDAADVSSICNSSTQFAPNYETCVLFVVVMD